MEYWEGRVLSKVRIERLIGRGGMADVYLGWHTTLNRPMAVKILHPNMTADSDVRRRFRDEAQAVAALRHPNIVQVNDFDVVDDRPYIIMELLEGMSLADYLRGLHGIGQSLPLQGVSRMMMFLTSALDYAHRRGIVHRDVKPANIILRASQDPIRPASPLGPEVEPVLTDFGVARIASSTTPTASGTILGTPAYMSPEQVRGEPVDARSDIYSLGIILYEILAGKLPFDPETDTPASILFKHVNDEPPLLTNVSPAIQDVVTKALAKQKESRYQEAGRMAAELHTAISNLPDETTSKPRVTQLRRPSAGAATPQAVLKDKPWLRPVVVLVALALGGLVLIGGAVLGGRLVRQASEATGVAVVATEAPSALAEQETPTQERSSDGEVGVVVSTDQQPGQAEPAGFAYVRDSSLEIRLRRVDPPPEGESYHAWLLGEEDVEPLHLNRSGDVEWIGGELIVAYAHPESINLLSRYRRFVVSLEARGGLLTGPGSVNFEGEVTPQTAGLVRLADEETSGNPLLGNLLDLLVRQTGHFYSHAGFALDGFEAEDLATAKLHTEHTLNILDGKGGEYYGDWDRNDRVENPGDEVGLLPYLRLLQAAAQGTAEAEQDRGRSGDRAASISQRAGSLADQMQDVRETARQILLADAVSAIRNLGLDDELRAGRGLRAQIEQLALDASGLELVFVIEVTPAQ